MPPGAPEITVVIPVFNEEGIVATACRDLMTALDGRGWDYELLLSENGSRDRTAEVLQLLEAANARGTTVVVATHDRSLLARHKKRVVALEGGRVVSDGAQARPGGS